MAASSSSSPASSSVLCASKEKTNGTKLARLLIDGGTDTLRKFFHTIHPPERLKEALNNHKTKLEALKTRGSRGVIFKSQWEKLFPPSNEAPDSRTFDITLLHLLLREICNLKAPSTGWHDLPAEDDTSPEANIATVKHFRNKLCHRRSTGISDAEFEDYWNKISQALSTLEITTFQKKIHRLKNDSIDHAIQQRLDKVLETWGEMELRDEHDLSSCIPDQGVRVFGRENEVNQVKEALLCGKGVVLITGGPGFGKTTVAKKVAREFPETSDEEKVFFCSIASKVTSSDVALEMILATGKGGNQPPEKPEYWLQHWSGRLEQKVVFVLDNADDVLNQESDSFLNLLVKIRNQSRQKIKFVVTSREEFKHPDLDICHIKLDCLPKDKAKQVLLSQVDNPQRVSDPDNLVELCGCVPLALCIAGSLLTDYTEQRLIELLKQDPSGILRDRQRPANQQSVEKTIMASLKSLSDKSYEKALVLVTVFRGSFTSTAAKAVFVACPDLKIPAEETLRFLKGRSLIEQVISGDDVSSRRYQMHLLVQDCLERMGKMKYPELLNHGKRLALSYFMTCISENTEQYWGKDTSRQAIKSFNDDRRNFEHFLQNYVHEENLRDPETTEVFFTNFAQKCMYLEKCVVPRTYKLFLEDLESFMMLAKDRCPVHQVELLCLLADVTSKLEGRNEKYKECILSARQMFNENYTDFLTNPLSEVLFRNFYAAFLASKQIKTTAVEIEKQRHIALKLCREKLSPNHPETAATLLFAGEHVKKEDREKAMEIFKESLEMFKQSLGDHPMTAQALKKLADFHFYLKELDRSLELYKEALKVFETIGEVDHQDCVLILKNLGKVHRKKKNFEEATEVIQRAEEICLQDSNRRKLIMVRTEMAILHDDKGERDQAKMVMKESLNCWCKDLGLTVNDLPNRKEIISFLDLYPEL